MSGKSISTHTPLARRDDAFYHSGRGLADFYSHASREARRPYCHGGTHHDNFYSHASREARRLPWSHILFLLPHFYSHASREARLLQQRNLKKQKISTHTPLARRDREIEFQEYCTGDFYSHASREARRYTSMHLITEEQFLLTRLSRGATDETE